MKCVRKAPCTPDLANASWRKNSGIFRGRETDYKQDLVLKAPTQKSTLLRVFYNSELG
jgi:hypothetical protein